VDQQQPTYLEEMDPVNYKTSIVSQFSSFFGSNIITSKKDELNFGYILMRSVSPFNVISFESMTA